MEFEQAAAQRVRARLELNVDDAAERPAELGRVGARLQLELVERVDAREDDDGLEPGLVVVDAVEHVVVVARPLAVRREGGRRAPGEAARAVDVGARNAAQHAGDAARQLTKLRPLSGSVPIASSPIVVPVGRLRRDERRRGFDRDGLGHRADFEFQVNAHALIDADLDVRERDGAKALQLPGHGIDARRERRRGVFTVRVGDDGAGITGPGMGERDGRTRHHRAGGVGDGAENSAGHGLRGDGPRHEGQDDGECETERDERTDPGGRSHPTSLHAVLRAWAPGRRRREPQKGLA